MASDAIWTVLSHVSAFFGQKAGVVSRRIYIQHALQHLQRRPCRWPFSTLQVLRLASTRVGTLLQVLRLASVSVGTLLARGGRWC
jgi:hypothetical protein